MREFPAITLWQPWASLIFAGVKRHETRAFRLPERLVGVPVAIHAAARSARPAELSEELRAICWHWWGHAWETSLPHRAVLGLVRFGASVPTEEVQHDPDDRDQWCGDFGPGRYAWPILPDLFRLERPFPATGRQGWWRANVPGVPEFKPLAPGGQLGE